MSAINTESTVVFQRNALLATRRCAVVHIVVSQYDGDLVPGRTREILITFLFT